MTIIFVIASVLGIMIIGVAGVLFVKKYWYYNYKNEAAGFTMKYPATWAVKENYKGAVVIFHSPVENALDFFQENVNIVIQDLTNEPNNLVIYTEKAIRQLKAVFGKNAEILESTEIYLDDMLGNKLVLIGKGGPADVKYMIVWGLKDNKAYQFTYAATVPDFDRYFNQVEKMMASFHLL